MPRSASSGPLFVVGVWRSGTSLLYALLNRHSQIRLMYEAELPLLRPLFVGGSAKRDWLRRWDFWNSALTRHRVEPCQIQPPAAGLRSAAETVYRSYALQKGAVVWGEKSPNYWDRLDRLAREFPHARFIIIWRNPMAICRSVAQAGTNASFFAKAGMARRALFACEKLRLQCERLVALGIPTHQLQYEDLIRDPDATLAEVSKFLGIPFEPQMASLRGADRSSIYEGQLHALAKGERIVSSGERQVEGAIDLLAPRFREKIRRYIALWKRQYRGAWPSYPLAADVARVPSLWERVEDHVLFWLLRRFDSAVVLVYCFVPLWLLSAYRARKRRTGASMAAAQG